MANSALRGGQGPGLRLQLRLLLRVQQRQLLLIIRLGAGIGVGGGLAEGTRLITVDYLLLQQRGRLPRTAVGLGLRSGVRRRIRRRRRHTAGHRILF